MDNSPKKYDISKRILETRKQTEELKAQLQNLIDSGINSSLDHNKVSDHSNFDKENIESKNKVQIIKSYDAKHSLHINKPSSSKAFLNTKQRDKKAELNVNKESPKKVRNYDVNEAREYIKRQREKRLEQLKSQNNEKLKTELQKQKLLELHKKSLELVTKNVQAKRERSNSRERTEYVRPDQNIPTRNRSRSRERNCLNNGRSHFMDYNKHEKPLEQPKNLKVEAVNRRKPNLRLSSDCKVPQQKTQSEANHHQEPTQKSVQEQNHSHRNNIQKNDSSVLGVTQKNTPKSGSNSDIKQRSLKPVNLFNQPLETNESGKEKSQNTEDNVILSVNNILDYKSSKSAGSITLPPPKEVHLVPEKINLGQPVTLISSQANEYHKPTCKLSEVAIGTDNLERDSKETQTNESQKVEFPLWLQEKPMQAYPFNFINTVKRKLQYAVNSPKPTVEIGVQSSFPKEVFKPQTPESFKTKGEMLEALQRSTKSSRKTNLNSFISHKCLNLDPKTMDHLELIPKQHVHRSQTVTKVSEMESESDTSKNIPEISSESGNSLKKNAESVKQNGTSSALNVEKISSMKLIPHSSTSIIQSEVGPYSSEVQQTEVERNTKSHRTRSKDTINKIRESKTANSRSNRTDDNQYTSDFHSGSELSKSRESIISHNGSTYDKVIHSISRLPEAHKSIETESLISEKHSTYIPQTITSVHSRTVPKSISLRNGNREKYPRSASSNTTGKDDMLDIIPTKNSELIASDSRRVSRGTDTISNSKENVSSSSIATDRKSRTSDKNTEELQKFTSKSSTKSSKISENYTSLFTESCPSPSDLGRISKSESSLQNINTHRGSNNFSESDKLTEVFPLKEPTLSLTVANKETIVGKYDDKNKSILTRNIALRPDKNHAPGEFNDTNEIHLKFEAEIHLLNDFNESLRQFSAVEKAFESLKSKNDSNMTLNKILQNRDTQTSIRTKSSTSTRVTESIKSADGSKSQVSTINYSRGSIINVDSSNINLDNSKSQDNNSLISTGLEISSLNKGTSVVGSNPDLSNFENLQSNNFAGMSLRMFEQLIKDEDVRLENLKTILKIREQALLDRTKGELAWLEIQRKHLRETGKLHEASLIKKKQRGILVNHQKEKHEMQRLKQMQKAASLERKIILKEQRNLIKHQLSTDNMLSKMKVNTPRERRLSGPLKVVQSHTESLRSETSVSRRSSSDKDKDVISITSHTHSVVSKVSEVSGDDARTRDAQSDVDVVDLAGRLASEATGVPISNMKKSLLMREAALQKRRRAAEELLQWHKKLLEEERRITELELAANAIISHIPNNVASSTDVEEKYRFKGKQLNQLWFNLTGCEVKKFAEDKIYPMSQIALERFCKSARQYSSKTKKILRKLSDSDINSDYSGTRSEGSVSENIPDQKLSASIRTEVEQSRKQSSSRNDVPTTTVNDYTSDFDVESIEEIANENMNMVDQSINRLIDNFSKIKKDISSLSLKQSLKSGEDREQDTSQRSEKSESDVDISVIETNKTSKEEESGSEEVILRLTSDKMNMSNKTASTIEEIKDTLSKSEAVLLKLTEAEEGTKKLSLSDELQVATKETSVSRTDKGVLSLKDLEEVSTDVSMENSHDKSSDLESKEHGSSSRTKESMLRLGNTEDGVSTDVLSNKNSSIKEGKNNLSKTEEILKRLGQLEDKISTNTSSGSVEQSPKIEEVFTDKEDNLTKSKDILQRLTRSEEKVSTDVSKDDMLSSNESEIIEESRESGENKDSLNNDKEITHLDGKISTDVPSDTSSSQKLAAIEVNVVSGEGKDNLSKTEEILAKLSQSADRISTDVSNDISKEPSVITESCMDNLIKSEEILLRLQEEDGSGSEISSGQLNKERQDGDDSTSNKTSVTAESETHSAINGTEDLVAINESDKISTDVASTKDSFISKKTSSRKSEYEPVTKSREEGFAPRDERRDDDRSIDKNLESFGETNIDEELSIDEESKSLKTTSVEQVGEPTKEDIAEVKAGENTPAENNHIIEEYKVVEDKLAEEISKEPSTTNESSKETIESKEDSDLRKTDSIVSTKEIVSKTSEDTPQLSETLEQNTSNKEDLSQITSLDVHTDIEESDKSVRENLIPFSKEDVNSYYDEKEQDSLSSSATSGSQLSVVTEKEDKATSDKSKSTISEEKSSKSEVVDVKKRVSEIMADTSQPSRGDKSPRLQDLYVTTYDLVSPASSPELGSPMEELKIVAAKSVFGSEAEELLRKQLAIEQEIKQITEQQQKEQPPYLFVREIPNKPPPPYIPPSSLPPVNVITIVPTTIEIEEISKYSAKILHKAYLSHNLDNISISENTLGLISKNITKECYKFVFDLCKEISKEHYKQFEKEKCPSWLQVTKKPQLTVVKPLDVVGLEKHLTKNLKELFGYEKPVRRENAIIKWSRKNRDHVDEILVMESQVEEAQWTNYDKDELLVMNEATNEIMNMLLKETGQVLSKILSKRTYLY